MNLYEEVLYELRGANYDLLPAIALATTRAPHLGLAEVWELVRYCSDEVSDDLSTVETQALKIALGSVVLARVK